MYLVDTNIIIRFLTRDNEKMFLQVQRLFTQATAESLLIPDAICAEVVYVLQHVYHLSELEIADKLSRFIEFEAFKVNKKLLLHTLYLFAKEKVGFIDAYLLAKAKISDYDGVYSFDERLQKIGDGKVISP